MRLFEAILDANHRAVAGDATAGLHPAEYAESLPVVALTCIDPRLNAYFPNVMALPGDQFIWLRNAGNIITGPISSTMRSLALACAVKGGREIAIIGHTDCQICSTPTMVLLNELQALGVDRNRLPQNLSEFFGLFGSERQNVIKAVDLVRHSPLIGPKIPVHGLLLDIDTGKLDWVVNGYEALLQPAPPVTPAKLEANLMDALGSFADFKLGEMKFPEGKIGEIVSGVLGANNPAKEIGSAAPPTSPTGADYHKNFQPKVVPPATQAVPPQITATVGKPGKLPLPPPIRPAGGFRRGR